MTSEPLLVELKDGVATVTLNRPEALNAFNVALKVGLRAAIEGLETNPDVRAIVLTGAGRAFCVGQDLKEHVDQLGATETPLDTVGEHFNPLVRRLAAMPKPVVAAVRGVAAGAGASLALLADFRVGGPGTSFLMAFANVGLAGDTGVSWTLPRLVGQAKALELLLLAEPVKAPDALRLGLLSQLTEDDDQVLTAAHQLAARLAAGPTVAYGQIKRQLLVGASGSLDQALDAEAEAQRIAGATADHRNATAAFVAKQKPTFTGS
jgi:2-(1,2-epoxy-1,2-dihydrophenyl)acetyl-CoA isomerase